MTDKDWRLKQIADFFYLLVDSSDQSGKDVLQKRLKKEVGVHTALFNLISKIDELGYKDGIEFAFSSSYFDTVKNTDLSLIEIRRFGKTWRAIAYWSREKEKFVILDAFEAHRHKSMNEMVKQVKPLVNHAMRLLGEGE